MDDAGEGTPPTDDGGEAAGDAAPLTDEAEDSAPPMDKTGDSAADDTPREDAGEATRDSSTNGQC